MTLLRGKLTLVAATQVGASLKVFDMLMEDSSLVETVLRNTHHFRE